MNKQNFKNDNQSYPISTDTLDFMQDTDNLISKLTAVNGSNYIITQSSAVTDGVIVLANEVMPLKGNPAAFIEIVEESEDITILETTYTAARTVRYATYKNVSTSGINRNQVPILSPMCVIDKGSRSVNMPTGDYSTQYYDFEISLSINTEGLNKGYYMICTPEVYNYSPTNPDYFGVFLQVVQTIGRNVKMRAWKITNAFPPILRFNYIAYI